MTTSFDLHAFNQAIIDEFRGNGGRVGGSYPFSGRPMVVLHHRGARTGAARVTPLGYEPDGEGSMLIFGTMGGSPTDPAWCHNSVSSQTHISPAHSGSRVSSSDPVRTTPVRTSPRPSSSGIASDTRTAATTSTTTST